MSSSSFARVCTVRNAFSDAPCSLIHSSERDAEPVDCRLGVQCQSHKRPVTGESRESARVDLKAPIDRISLVFLEFFFFRPLPAAILDLSAASSIGSLVGSLRKLSSAVCQF